MQENMVKNDAINISDYYKSLDRVDRAKFSDYLLKSYDFKFVTLNNKLNGHRKFNSRDSAVINQVISQGLWRQDR